MTPLEKIKSGILEQDWLLVIDGYASMTGENLGLPAEENQQEKKSPTKKKAGRPRKKKQESPDNFSSAVLSTKSIIEEIARNRTKISGVKNGFTNLFVDDGVEESEHKLSEEEKKKMVPTSRSRPSSMRDVGCTECRKDFRVHSSYLRDGLFTCQKCLKKKAGL